MNKTNFIKHGKNFLFIMFCMMSFCTHAEWKILTQTDEMTDVVSHLIYTEGSVVDENSWYSYKPVLVIKITPHLLIDKVKLKIYVITEEVVDDDYIATIRFDKHIAKKIRFNRFANCKGLSFYDDDIKYILDNFKHTKQLRLKYVGWPGEGRITTFNIDGFYEQYDYIINTYCRPIIVKRDITKLKIDWEKCRFSKYVMHNTICIDPDYYINALSGNYKSIKSYKLIKCKNCRGRGTVKQKTRMYKDKTCPMCKGRGGNCSYCNRTGWVEIPYTTECIVECDKCDGFGKLEKIKY